MTKKEFFNIISNEHEDLLQKFLNLLIKLDIEYCVIGGLAVNSYVEPLVSLDLDVVIIANAIDTLKKETVKIFKIEEFHHSLNLSNPKTDLRIQIQTDVRYQSFIPRSLPKEVMGYKMKVASIEDVLQGKIWAYCDNERRKSKRQKDLADIFRLIENFPDLKILLPETIKNLLIHEK
ncbi:MAG: nucleotidyl transferase AbiEii/AbiGii toxin family protein [Candidatus Firestonebacteria bacterium]|nr:nucleotidyl transferase AbiEii/AbiGii toxin family protein [Candidatus Firestonebacteria bacterium]